MESFAPENNSVMQWFRHQIDYGIIGASEPHIDELEFGCETFYKKFHPCGNVVNAVIMFCLRFGHYGSIN